MPRVSLIICTYNRAKILPIVLESVMNQSFDPDQLETILVNDGSTDQTDFECKQYDKKIKNLIYIKLDKNVGLSKCENIAIKHVNSDHILFSDDDCILDPDWVMRMHDELSRHAIVTGKIQINKAGYLELARNIAEFHPFILLDHPREIQTIAGANMGFQRSVIETLDLFSPKSSVPDFDLAIRAISQGYKIYYSPDCLVIHTPPTKSLWKVWEYEAHRSFFTIQLRNKYLHVFGTPFILQSSSLLLLLSPLISFAKTMQIFFSNLHLVRYLYTFPYVFCLKLAWCWGAYKGLRSIGK
jgi:GT2 family glycosyltransferase